ncbi:ABC transporter permease [Collinsella tanakaei]|uniref:ABC transporter permease n=1 Tax=Collinsella tanakaei TaxID=626935 RepID=UPI00195A4234|nr:ABC transporter permease [Collinsella tanakaei]MBM6777917.1 ABC transporter permease [Collinsella tanakaei]
MSIFTRFTLQSLKRNRTRTVVSIIGIALSCALITAVLTSVVSLSNMLIQRTGAEEGWWYGEVMPVDEQSFATLTENPKVTDWVGITCLGTVSLGDENDDLLGRYLYAKTWPATQDADEPLVKLPEIVAGHAPEAAGEVILPHYLQNLELAPCGIATADGGAIGLGSQLVLDLGTRTITNLADGSSYVAMPASGDTVDEETQTDSYAADLGKLTVTVAGFFRAYGYAANYALQGSSAYIYDDGSAVENALADGSDATWASLLFRTKNPAAAEGIVESIANSSSTAGGSVHESLLRWMGATPDKAVWNTLYQIAGILAAVVVVAGVSLIYNSFAISVAERTRQFGLLSSLGASRRQLRRTVLTEALVIGGVGIPIGLALGLVGCFVVFSLLGEGIATMVGGTDAHVVVHPVALLAAIALSLVTLLVSAAVPAIRASRVSAVDAIRQTQDVRLSRATRRRLRRVPQAGYPTSRRLGIAGRLFGIPGFIAHRNLSRSSSKGRVTVAALAVSVALLITSGSIANVMSYASDTSIQTMEGQDLVVYIDATGAEADRTLALAYGQVDGPAMQKALARFYADASQIEGADPNGYTTSYMADLLVPAGILNDEVMGLDGALPPLADGSWYGPAYVEFIDDSSWQAYIGELGLSRGEFCDPTHPRAIAVNAYRTTDGETYGSYSPFEGTGTVRSLEFADLDGYFVSDIEDGPDGSPQAMYYDNEGKERYLPLAEAVAAEQDIEIGALADELPEGVVNATGTLQLILPASAIDLADTMGYTAATTSFDCGGDATQAAELQDELESIAKGYPELDLVYSNTAQGKLQARLMATTVNTFIYCFAAITGLIAVANVFNTLANALMLRRREFAMLKSIGMGDSAFRRMIAYECASYALRGFMIGFAIAALATFGLYQSMVISYSTYEFSLPWPQVGISVLAVAVVIAASVAYALARNRSWSIVESLRDDAI